jgi:hypothetical protein
MATSLRDLLGATDNKLTRKNNVGSTLGIGDLTNWFKKLREKVGKESVTLAVMDQEELCQFSLVENHCELNVCDGWLVKDRDSQEEAEYEMGMASISVLRKLDTEYGQIVESEKLRLSKTLFYHENKSMYLQCKVYQACINIMNRFIFCI